MPDISPVQLIIVLIIALVILGPKRLPEVGRSLGKGIREFKDSVSGKDEPDEAPRPAGTIEAPQPAPPAPPTPTYSAHDQAQQPSQQRD